MAVVAAVASGRVEPLALAAPMLVGTLVGVVASGRAEFSASVSVEPERVTEGDQVCLRVWVDVPSSGELDLVLDLPDGVRPMDGLRHRRERVEAGGALVEVPLLVQRWGAFPLGGTRLRRVGPLGVLSADLVLPAGPVVRAYPTPTSLRRLARARETSLASGNHVARVKGPGVEFADVRPYVPGDRVREVNWRLTARRNELWVNERHPERANDVVVFVDAFNADELARAVPAADGVLRAYLARRDRVGLVSFGGTVRWVRPGSGLRQQYLVVDALLATSAFASVAWRDLEVVPPGVLPHQALVIAVSPLRDRRGVSALWDLRSRGADLAILEVETPRRSTTAGRRSSSADQEALLTDRIRVLQRDLVRDEFRALGVRVSRWGPNRPLAQAVEELSAVPPQARGAV